MIPEITMHLPAFTFELLALQDN